MKRKVKSEGHAQSLHAPTLRRPRRRVGVCKSSRQELTMNREGPGNAERDIVEGIKSNSLDLRGSMLLFYSSHVKDQRVSTSRLER